MEGGRVQKVRGKGVGEEEEWRTVYSMDVEQRISKRKEVA
jgi:hypothetical protein